MKEFLEGLFTYDKAVNEKMITAIKEHVDKLDDRTLQLISHIVSVHEIWNTRMLLQEVPVSDNWRMPDLLTLQEDDTRNHGVSLEILNTHDLSEIFTYKNTKGLEWHNTRADVLYHIISHNNYHRGQINARLRNSGVAPVLTDYIAYLR